LPKTKSYFWLSIKKILRNIALYFLISSIGICLLLRWLPPPTTAFMLYRHYQDLLEDHSYKPNQYRWVNSRQISPKAYAAVIAAEDQLFFDHFGFDLHSIESSIDHYIDGGHLRGASTISQQVAKNLFLTPSKSFIRKGIEVWFTFLIELLWSKDRILTVYLNIAEFGDHLYGIEAASQHYFKVSAKKISSSQAALLAATLPNPSKLKTNRPSNYLFQRQRWILRQMQNLGNQPYSNH
jgi:monofunctional biosynthetic peptidoglycan transglycosylase